MVVECRLHCRVLEYKMVEKNIGKPDSALKPL